MYHRISTKRPAASAATGLAAALLAILAGSVVACTTAPATQGSFTEASSPTSNVGHSPSGPSTRDGVSARVTDSRAVTRPTRANVFKVSRLGSGRYRALSRKASFRGSLQSVVERSVDRIKARGGAGTVRFTAGDFDLGADYFHLVDIHRITFAGAGMNATVIHNNNSTANDTEPFNFYGAFGVTVRDMTVSAGGSPRPTSDALDFDRGNNSTVENVKITHARGRGIVFDGKNENWQSLNNTIRNCVITGASLDGIELLASSNNTVEGCRISNVRSHGIEIAKASAVAPGQPNKKSSGNIIRNNVIKQAGEDGIRVNGGDNNVIRGNTVTNSADEVGDHDGIRIGSTDGISCNRNRVLNNVATDNQSTRTQRYGLNISTPLCHHTVVSGNRLKGNRLGRIHDEGTATQRR